MTGDFYKQKFKLFKYVQVNTTNFIFSFSRCNMFLYVSQSYHHVQCFTYRCLRLSVSNSAIWQMEIWLGQNNFIKIKMHLLSCLVHGLKQPKFNMFIALQSTFLCHFLEYFPYFFSSLSHCKPN